LAIKDKKYKWLFIPLVLLVFMGCIIGEILSASFLFPFYLLNLASVLLWICIAKQGYNIFTWNILPNITVPPVMTNNAPRRQTETPVNPRREPAHYNKGWITDNTSNMEVNILTIEDIINPIPLKNEHEKSTKELINYIRKLKRQSLTDITVVQQNEKVLLSFENYFQSVKLDSVRSVFIRALYLLIEDYSFQDYSVATYLEKFTINDLMPNHNK